MKKKPGRKPRRITITSVGKPDPEVAVKTLAPLLLERLRQERAKTTSEPPPAEISHWGEIEQLSAAINIRTTKDASAAALILRSCLALERELRDALADLLEGRIKRKSGPRPDVLSVGQADTEHVKTRFRKAISRRVKEGEGVTRDTAIQELADRLGKTFDQVRKFIA